MPESQDQSFAREPRTALLLSSLCCGLGHLYCGRAGRGLVIFGASLLAGPLLLALSTFSAAVWTLTLFLFTLAAAILFYLWSVWDAWRISRRMSGQPYVLADYNSRAVYAVLIASSLPYAFGLAAVLRMSVAEAFVVPSGSMTPTILPGDRLLTTKVGLRLRDFQRGDVVVFRSPENRRLNWIKRVVGLPGETIEVRDGKLHINGVPAAREPVAAGDPLRPPVSPEIPVEWEQTADTRYLVVADSQTPPGSSAPIKLHSSQYFVLGDNRGKSIDSREFGPISHGDIIGLAKYIYWPAASWSRFGALNNPPTAPTDHR